MIHKTAVIEDGATIGAGVEMGPYCVIEAGVTLGDGVVLGPHVTVLGTTTIGARTRVHAGAVIGDWPQDLAYEGAASAVIIGENCVLREGVTIHRGTKEGTETVLGDRCMLMANAHVAHNCTLGNDVILANGTLLGGYVSIDDGAFISGNCTVHQFCRVGRLAMMGGMSGVSKDVPPFCMAKSHVANRLVGLNVIGLRRAGLSPAQRKEVKEAFALLYKSDLTTAEACRKIDETFADSPARELSAFAAASERGICGLSA